MSEPVINVRGLSKKYLLGTGGNSEGLRHVIQNAATSPLRWFKKSTATSAPVTAAGQKEFWALKDVSFNISQGEVVAVIGRNGAGKSTLLKVLSRITEPTEGSIEISGRVASLLEVGTGFHPELSGRENIFLNGAILGMGRAEIRSKFDEIVAFAEVEKFLDTPVKRYSSGMYVRLAFAVAAHLEPEILIVDEVLAVGDAQFQKKCLGKMQEVSKGGRTVLLVSHNMAVISQLTRKSILMVSGKVGYEGDTSVAVGMYSKNPESDSSVFFDVENAPRKWVGTQHARFVSLRFDKNTPLFEFEEDFHFIAKIRALEKFDHLRFSMTIFTSEGVAVGSCFTANNAPIDKGETAEYLVTLKRPQLAPGQYYVGVGVGKGNHKTGQVDYDVILETLHFEVCPEAGKDGSIATWTRGWGSIIFGEMDQQLLKSR